MTTNHQTLRELAEKATPQNFGTAQIESHDGWVECPCCGGEGSVELTSDYCNYDDVAIGVQFYGVGDAHVNAEAYYRAANPKTILALLDEVDGLRVDAERWRQFLKMIDPDKVPGGFTVYYAIEEGTDQLFYADDDLNEIVDAARHAQGDKA